MLGEVGGWITQWPRVAGARFHMFLRVENVVPEL